MARNIVEWIKAHGAFVVLMLVGAWTAAFLRVRKTNQVNTIKAAIELEKRKGQVKILHAKQRTLRATDEVKANQVLLITAEISKHQQRIAEIHSGKSWKDLTDEEINRALADAGLR